MKLSIVAGATSQSVNVFIQNSSSTTGAGLTGLVYNTSGLTGYYTFAGANATATAITLATLAAVNSAFSSGGFKEIDSTNMPGVYRLDLPNAAIASAKGRSVLVYLQGATNMAPCVLEIELTGWDNQDAAAGGLSRIDAAISTRSTYAGADTAGTTTLLTRIPGTVAAQTGDSYARLGAPAGASHAADVAAVKVDTAAVKVQTDKLTFTVANQIDSNVLDWKSATAPAMTGDSFARLGAPAGASVSADVAAVKVDSAGIKAKTDNLPASPAAVSDIPTANANADALLDRAAGVETSWTVRQAMRIMLAALGGKLSGAATSTVTVRDMADAKNRISATVDSNGNRTAVTLDPS
jgi:hypothetical protein